VPDAYAGEEEEEHASTSRPRSIHSMTTDEWRQRFETDGYVDLWVEEEFNAGSRLVVTHISSSLQPRITHCTI
jgi:ferredoxin